MATARRPLRGKAVSRDPVARARERLDEDAATRWRVAPSVAEVLFVLPLVGTVFALAATQHDGLFSFLVREDSLFESLQAVAYALAFGFAGLTAALAWRRGERAVGAVFALVAAGSLFLAGEEVSWGQRLFGFETPERLEGVNVQEEANVHNISLVRAVLKLGALAVGLAGLLAPWLVRPRGSAGRFVPPIFLTSAFLVLVGYHLGRLVFFPEGFFGTENNYVVGRLSEWPELSLAYAVAAFAFVSWRARENGFRSP